MAIYRFLNWISNTTSGLAVLLVCYCAWKAIGYLRHGDRESCNEIMSEIKNEANRFAGKYSKVLIVAGLISTLLTSTTLHQLIGIHDLRIKPAGIYCFYVEATDNSGKTYVLPAQIEVEEVTEDIDDGKRRVYRQYYIEKIYFPDGVCLDVDDDYPDSINKVSYYEDDELWEIVLLNEHAYSPEIEETITGAGISIIFLMIKVISFSVLLYLGFYENKKVKKKAE